MSTRKIPHLIGFNVNNVGKIRNNKKEEVQLIYYLEHLPLLASLLLLLPVAFALLLVCAFPVSSDDR